MAGRRDYADNARVTLRHIKRIEDDGFGWLVNFSRRDRSVRKYFPDGVAGPIDSLRAAIVWRDAQWRDIGPPRRDRPTQSRSSETGIVGVTRETYKTTSGNVAQRYRAQWPRVGAKPGRRSFSIDKNGEQKAKRLAHAARARGLEEEEKKRRERLLDEVHRRQGVVGLPTASSARGDSRPDVSADRS